MITKPIQIQWRALQVASEAPSGLYYDRDESSGEDIELVKNFR
jgi:hypothetical protein